MKAFFRSLALVGLVANFLVFALAATNVGEKQAWLLFGFLVPLWGAGKLWEMADDPKTLECW
jgi:hypothetical protein